MQFMSVHPAAASSFRAGGGVQLWSGRCPALGPAAGTRHLKRRLVFVSANEPVDEPEDGDDKGDKQVQDILVGMVRLQAGKMRVSEFVEDRSKMLSDIADQAKEEYDKIAQDAMRTMDEAGSKIISSVDAEAQEMEEELAKARAEMEADSRDFDEFEENVDKARSEGLFFKSLYSKPLKAWNERTKEEKKAIKEEASVVYNTAKKSGSSKTRRFLYGVLIFLLSLSLVEALSNGNYEWPKLALYSFILVALVVQLTYESFVASDGDDSKESIHTRTHCSKCPFSPDLMRPPPLKFCKSGAGDLSTDSLISGSGTGAVFFFFDKRILSDLAPPYGWKEANDFKTIDGRGAEVHITNQVSIKRESHVIIHGVHVHDVRPSGASAIRVSPSKVVKGASEGDGIHIWGSSNVWVDHSYLAKATDGLVDIMKGSTDVTVSNNYLTNHKKVMLLGASPKDTMDRNMRVTVAFNKFGPGLVQRLPRARYGVVHVLNNDYSDGWGLYAIVGSVDPTILSQGNQFNAKAAREVTRRIDVGGPTFGGWQKWNWASSGDVFLGGAYFTGFGATASSVGGVCQSLQRIGTPCLYRSSHHQ